MTADTASTDRPPARTAERILEYLSSRGGTVASADGRGITRSMAQAVGCADLSTLNAMLVRLARKGLIDREVRGRRTYRIALAQQPPQRSLAKGANIEMIGEGDDLVKELCHPRRHLHLCVLLLVAQRPAHGYDIVQRLAPFGYEGSDPAQAYRALQRLEAVQLVEPNWETAGPGPARRVFDATVAGRRVAQDCGQRLRSQMQAFEDLLSSSIGPAAAADRGPCFEVLVETKLLVQAKDEALARCVVEEAMRPPNAVADGVETTGTVWVYDAVPVPSGSDER